MEFKSVALASDHAGVELKKELSSRLAALGVSVSDLGAFSNESVDYPDLAALLGKEVSNGKCQAGIGICGSGIGMAICANKYRGVRAASAWDVESARLSREHNNANILCLGARFFSADEAWKMVETWVNTAFAGDRHSRRVNKIAAIEKENFRS